jgi:hypothetical protein
LIESCACKNVIPCHGPFLWWGIAIFKGRLVGGAPPTRPASLPARLHLPLIVHEALSY